jgi:TRAP-type C4-dicarboxylate transport system permease large subunit
MFKSKSGFRNRLRRRRRVSSALVIGLAAPLVVAAGIGGAVATPDVTAALAAVGLALIAGLYVRNRLGSPAFVHAGAGASRRRWR